jgi:hypothetical protein
MTPADRARYARQLMLPSFYHGGQSRLCESVAAVDGDGLAHDVARRYAERAGFARTDPGAIDLATAAPDTLVANDAARQVLAGSRAALAEIRRVVLAQES